MLAAGRAACRTTAVDRRAARTVLPDGRVLRLPGRHRRPGEPAGLPRHRRRGHARSRRRQGARDSGLRLLRSDAAATTRGRRRRAGGPRCRGAAHRATGSPPSLFDEQHLPGGQIYRGVPASPFVARAECCSVDDYAAGTALIDAFPALGRDPRRRGHVSAAWPRPRRGTTGELTVALGAEAARADRDRPRRRGDSRDRRAGASVPDSRLDAARRDDRGRGAAAAQDLGPRAGAAARARRSRPAAVAAGDRSTSAVGVVADAPARHHAAGRYAEAATHASSFLTSDYFMRGLRLLREVQARLRVVEHVTALAAEGDGRLASVRYEKRRDDADRRRRRAAAAPRRRAQRESRGRRRLRAALERRCRRAWEPVVDDWGGSDGAERVHRRRRRRRLRRRRGGRRAASSPRWRSANALGRIDATARDRAAAEPRKELMLGHCAAARFFDTLYRPADAFRAADSGDTIVCRCEEVTAQAPSSTPSPRGVHRAEPAEGVRALRHGAVPGPVLRPDGDRDHRPRSAGCRRRTSATSGSASRSSR